MPITAHTIVHDQSHLEVCLDYPLSSRNDAGCIHKTDFYFFIPKVMAISASSYPRDQFYNDITNYIRAHTPVSESGEWQLLQTISQHIEELTQRKNPEIPIQRIVKTIKFFGNALNKRLKDSFDKLQDDPTTSVVQFAAINSVLQQFREQCVQKIIKPTLYIPYDIRHVILVVDEFISNRMEAMLAEVNAQLVQMVQNPDHDAMRLQIKAILEKEIEYRKIQSNLFFVRKNTEAEKEYFFYRQGLLKKAVALPLFLTFKKRKQEPRYRSVVASIGASLAAIWAQFAEHHTYKATHASDVGLQFIAVAIFAVAIYVFKDRIKDLSKDYVNEKLKDHIPDLKGTLSNKDLGIAGNISEYVRYLDEKNLSAEVRFLRRWEGRWDIEHPIPDTVLHYHRSAELKVDKSNLFDLNVTSIKDILRFNFSFFLKHLDDPLKQYTSYDDEYRITKVNFPKVYHLNMVVRMATEIGPRNNKEERVDFERYRLVFNRVGIIRMESLSDKQKLFYTEDPS